MSGNPGARLAFPKLHRRDLQYRATLQALEHALLTQQSGLNLVKLWRYEMATATSSRLWNAKVGRL
jgi:hypothetical protein